MVLECFEAWGRLLLPRDVCTFRHLLPLQARFIHVEHLLGLVTPLLDDGPETIWVGSSGVLVSALSLSRALIMEPIAGLELIKPACAGRELRHGAGLLLLQVVVAIHGLLLDVVKGHVKALTLPLIYPCDQHFLHMDHDVRLARWHLGGTTTCPCFYDCCVFFLSFLIIRNVDSGRLSALRMEAVDSSRRTSLKCPIIQHYPANII